MSVNLPGDLLEPIGLAQDIYSSWRELMITDKVDGAAKWPTWLTLSPDWRNSLVEAVRMQVTEHLNRTQDALDNERAVEEAFSTKKGLLTRQCYICEEKYQTIVKAGVPVCGDCRRANG